jgi:hypothetical protein
MIIYDKKTFAFNLPEYCGRNYVSVDVVYPNQINQITFFTESGNRLLFSVLVNQTNEHLLNNATLAYIKAKIENEIN